MITRGAKEAVAMSKVYPKGTRIELVSMDDPNPIPSGMKGTVDYIDDACQIHMIWDNRRTLPIVPDAGDQFRVIDR